MVFDLNIVTQVTTVSLLFITFLNDFKELTRVTLNTPTSKQYKICMVVLIRKLYFGRWTDRHTVRVRTVLT